MSQAADGSVVQDLYTQHADVIEAALAYARRAHRLTADAGDEFASWARLKLIDNDYATLRKYEGRSSMRTYLVSVINHLFLDWRNVELGKWRPTTDAHRLGPLAVELERLIIRDRIAFGEAVEVLVSRGVAPSRAACDDVWAQLPQRPSRDLTGETELTNLPGPARADELLLQRERAEKARVTGGAMARALAALEPRDQLIFRLRFHDGFTVARIAKLIDEDQKALYRRFDRVCEQLRRTMLSDGASAADVADLLATPRGDLQPVFEDSMGEAENRPSTRTSTGGEHG